ncbi:MAG: adenylate kinase [Clostridiales bacterium]|jgi:adenylate kinase|nr:adenylate kinase [Clostridiales bacterium]
MVNIVLLGAPGAGKGTQAENISRKYGIPQISTGDIFRQNIKDGTPLGAKAKAYMDAGQLVPDELTISLVTDRLKLDDCKNGYILDGFPRNIAQAEALDGYLAGAGQRLSAVLSISVADQAIVDRLSGRRVCPACGKTYHVAYNPPKSAGACDRCGGAVVQRPDDEAGTVMERLAVYREQTAPLIRYYRTSGVFAEVPGRDRVEDTSADTLAALGGLLAAGAGE